VGSAKQYGYPAEMLINAGAHYVALDFIAAKEAGWGLGTMAVGLLAAIRL
jgi:arylformamidase